MTAVLFIALSLAGGVGAALRFFLDGALRPRLPGGMPWPTWVINVSGSLVLGLVTGLALSGGAASVWMLVIGTGLMGGYTTFSTASFETVRLLQQRRPAAAALNGLGMLVLSVAAAALGFWVGTFL